VYPTNRLNLYTLVDGNYYNGVVNGTSQILLRYCNSVTGKDKFQPLTNITTVYDGMGGTITGTNCLQVNHSFAGTLNKPLSICIANDALYIANVKGNVYKVAEGMNQLFPSGKVKVGVKFVEFNNNFNIPMNAYYGVDCQRLNENDANFTETSIVVSKLGNANATNENAFFSCLDNDLSAIYDKNVFYKGKDAFVPSIEIVETTRFSEFVDFNCYSAKLYKQNGDYVCDVIYGNSINVNELSVGKYYVEYKTEYDLTYKYSFEIRPTVSIKISEEFKNYIQFIVNDVIVKDGSLICVDKDLYLSYALYEGFEFDNFKLNSNVLSGNEVLFNNLGDSNVVEINAKTISYDINYKMYEDNLFAHQGSYTILDVLDSSALYKPTDKEGYRFVGWFLDNNLISSIADLTELKNVTLYGVYDVVTYNVTFDVNVNNTIIEGLTNEEYQNLLNSIKTQTVLGNGLATEQLPTINGYKFIGWYTDEALTSLYDFTSQVTSDVTLYAKWEKVDVIYEDTKIPDAKIEGEIIDEMLKEPTIFDKYDGLGVTVIFLGIGLGVVAIGLAVVYILKVKKTANKEENQLTDGGNNE
jgi:uncharacterized repeat protein (TIGR02543 family)